MNTETVVSMSDAVLDRQARRILTALSKDPKLRSEWVENQLEKADALAIAKKRFPATIKFGEWCGVNGFGDNVISEHTRAALIDFGNDLPRAKTILETTDRWSVEMIHKNEWRVGSAPKSPRTAGGGPKLQEAIDACLAYETTHGKLPPANRHFDIGLPGITESTYDRAIRAIISGRELAETLGPLKPTKAQAHHIEMMVKLEVKTAIEQLNASFETEVQKRNKAEIDKLFPDLEELRKKAISTERYFREQIAKKAVMPLQEWHDLMFLAHNKEVSEERKKRAAQTLIANKLILTGES